MTAKNFVGNAAATTLSSGINNSATSIPVTDASTWPTTNFNVVIDRGLVGEEKVFCTSRSGNTLTVTRAADNTTAAAHSSGAAVEHTAFAADFQAADDHRNASAAVHGLTGTVVGTSDAQTLTNKTLTAPVIGDFTNANHTHATTGQGGAVTVAYTVSSYTPALPAGWSLGNGTITGKYVQLGKLTFVDIYLDFGTTTTGSGAVDLTFTLPVAADTTIQPVGTDLELMGTFLGLSGNRYPVHGAQVVSGTVVTPQRELANAGTYALQTTIATTSVDSSSYVRLTGWYIAA